MIEWRTVKRRALPLLPLALACARGPATAPSPARLWLGGDVNLNGGDERALDPLRPLIAGAPGFVNLEGPVVAAPTSLKLWNDPRALPALRATGVRAAGIANNHTRDADADGPARSARALHAAGLLTAGGRDGAAIVTTGGLRVVITAHDLTNGVPPTLADELRTARAAGDRLVTTFHTTGEPSYLPSPELRRAVEIALAAGASVVAAHGSHRLGPVERRGDAVIAWGLGNLAFACDCTNEKDGLLLLVEFDGSGTKAAVVPIAAGLHGGPARPAEDPAAIFDLLKALGSSPLSRERDRARF